MTLIVGETVVRLAEIVDELETDPDIQVVVFDSDVPIFFNHFDLAAAADFPAPEGEDAVPIWTDLVLKLTKAPYVTVASIRDSHRGGGNGLPWRWTCATSSRENGAFGQPEWAAGYFPGRDRTAATCHRPDRALEVILTSADYDAETADGGAGYPSPPDADLDLLRRAHDRSPAGVRHQTHSLPSTKPMVNREISRRTLDLVAALHEFIHSLTLTGFQPRGRCQKPSSQGRARLRVPARRTHRHRKPERERGRLGVASIVRVRRSFVTLGRQGSESASVVHLHPTCNSMGKVTKSGSLTSSRSTSMSGGGYRVSPTIYEAPP